MSLATRCPACSTVFRVVRDQLKVSEGWVRCGRCAEVFNAGERLFELEPEAAASPPKPQPPPAPVALDGQTGWARGAAVAALPGAVPMPASGADMAALEDAALPVARSEDTQTAEPVDRPAPTAESVNEDRAPADEVWSPPPQAAEPAGDTPAGPVAEPEPEPVPEPEPAPADLRLDIAVDRAPTAAAVDAEPLPADRQESALPGEAVEAEPLSEMDLRADPAAVPLQPMPGFVLRAERAQRWRQPLRRRGLALACLLLLGTLGGQLAVHYRDDLSARWPATTPWLQGACQWLGCQVEPPRRIDSLAVDSSGLVRVEGSELYRLSLVVQNRSGLTVRMPAIDLALTDAQGRTAARRVLSVAELGHTADSLPPQGEVVLQAMLELGELRIAGYTVELFYP